MAVSEIRQFVFSCDRCGETVTISYNSETKTYYPSAWKKVTVRPIPDHNSFKVDYDLCSECASKTTRYIGTGIGD